MIRLGWKRLLVCNGLLTVVAIPLGVDAVSAIFAVGAVVGIVGLVQAARYYRPTAGLVWYVLAAAVGLFLIGGIVEVLTAPTEPDAIAPYPGGRELFDFTAYVAVIFAVNQMARARLASRDRTITLDALIGMSGVGALAWVGVMSSYLRSDLLTTAGKATGIAFTLVSLMLGFVIVRLAIGPGARPPSYYLLAAGATGGFISELVIELELSNRNIPNAEMLVALASSLAVVSLTAAALHPSMRELTEPPVEVTPKMTTKRLAAMAVAVLIPPALLLAETIRTNRYETVAIIFVWAVLSIMVMVRVFSLARVRERFSDLDRALATADAALVAAPGPAEMAEVVVNATSSIVSDVNRIAVCGWGDGQWYSLSEKGSHVRPLAHRPAGSRAEQSMLVPGGYQHDVHFEASEILTGAVSVVSATTPDTFELSRFSALIADFAKAVEAANIREQLGRERSERRFRALVENSADMIVVVGRDKLVSFVSPAGPRLLNVPEERILGMPLTHFAIPAHQPDLDEAIQRRDASSTQIQFDAGNGKHCWFDVHVSDMLEEPEIRGLVITASEISAQKHAQLKLEQSEARFRSLVQHASDLVAVVDADQVISWISPSSSRVLGIPAGDVVTRSVLDISHPESRHEMMAVLETATENELGRASEATELQLLRSDGTVRIVEVTATNLFAEPAVGGLVLNAHDVTERKTLEEDLRYQALHDDLTGLANRVMLRNLIGDAMEANDNIAVIIADLDDFKTINDGLGHSIGDDLLTNLASRLVASVRDVDTVARLGGDEFAILVTDIAQRTGVIAIAQRVLQVIQDPIDVSGRQIRLNASVGIAFASDVEQPAPETMIRSADLAMYGAKKRGKARVTIFDESMQQGAFERLELKADLAYALERDELLLHYQPVINMLTGAVCGFEALLRWNHAERGLVGPGTFIPLAEETGLIVPIGRWLADVALRQLRIWQDRYPSATPLTMSINVSGRQLEDERVVEQFADAVALAAVEPSSVMIELTESVLVEDAPDLVQRLNRIRSIGVGLHADDFGSGFASYSALQSLPFSGVKIDRSLVMGLGGEANDRAIAQISSIIEMAASTNIHVVAEGIETASQAAALRQMNCDYAQGFYFARPAEPSVIDEQLRQSRLEIAGTPAVSDSA